MDVGVFVPLPTYLVDVGVMARIAEELGFESIWCADHTIMPVATTSRFPGSADGKVPESYAHIADPFVSLARASGMTSRIRLGTGITLVPERNPLLLAKEISTLDLFSGGRFLFGIGTGWHREESTIMGGDFDHRWGQTREAVLAMKELWTKAEAEYHGKWYDFPPVRSYPKPAQKPHPPVLLGGHAPNVLQRVVAWGDGWMPSRASPDEVKTSRATLDGLARQAGRAPSSLSITVFGQPADRDLIHRYRDAGADRVIVWPPARARRRRRASPRCGASWSGSPASCCGRGVAAALERYRATAVASAPAAFRVRVWEVNVTGTGATREVPAAGGR